LFCLPDRSVDQEWCRCSISATVVAGLAQDPVVAELLAAAAFPGHDHVPPSTATSIHTTSAAPVSAGAVIAGGARGQTLCRPRVTDAEDAVPGLFIAGAPCPRRRLAADRGASVSPHLPAI
jgi:hypothetical protein